MKDFVGDPEFPIWLVGDSPPEMWVGALLVPYIVWVTIASYLNIGIWLINKPSKANSGRIAALTN